MKLLIVCLLLLSLTGCVLENVQSAAQKVTNKVCAMSLMEREALRATIDVATFPNKIRVECAGQAN